MQTAKSVSHVLDHVRDWAARQSTIAGVALVGSHARQEARADSDIDLVLLCTYPDEFLCDPSWTWRFGEVVTCQTEDWGLVMSLRVHYQDGFEVEFGMTTLEWAKLPIDPGTRDVVTHGMRILLDRQGMLARLQEAVAMHP